MNVNFYLHRICKGKIGSSNVIGICLDDSLPPLARWFSPSISCVLCVVTQSCLTLWNPTDCSPPGSSVHGILQARILEWVAMPSSRGSSQPSDQTQVSHIAGRFFTIWATKGLQVNNSETTIPLKTHSTSLTSDISWFRDIPQNTLPYQ